MDLFSHADDLNRMRERYAMFLNRNNHGASLFFVGFCFVSFASFTCFSSNLSPISHSDSLPSQMFYVFAGLAFFSSLSGLLLVTSQAVSASTHFHLAPLASIDEELAQQRRCLAADLPRMTYSVTLLTLAVFFLAGAFVLAGLTIQQEVKFLRLPVIVLFALSSFVFVQAMALTTRETLLVWSKISKVDSHLWNALRIETMFGCLVARYCSWLSGRQVEKMPGDHFASEI